MLLCILTAVIDLFFYIVGVFYSEVGVQRCSLSFHNKWDVKFNFTNYLKCIL